MPHVLRRDVDGRLRSKLDPAVVTARSPSDADPAQADAMLWAACAAIKCPTLIIRGSNSDMLTRAGAEPMANTIPKARLVEVEAGHVIPLENADGFYAAVRDFI
jgi:pimeloyl-ACP methyl ester carboxylesterase